MRIFKSGSSKVMSEDEGTPSVEVDEELPIVVCTGGVIIKPLGAGVK